jgi:predicted 2-oxoglutarate/Fe(II)-dependent dioxygenase YbiX
MLKIQHGKTELFGTKIVANGKIFPSTDTHRATSPTDGERISFTIWAMTKNPNRRARI